MIAAFSDGASWRSFLLSAVSMDARSLALGLLTLMGCGGTTASTVADSGPDPSLEDGSTNAGNDAGAEGEGAPPAPTTPRLCVRLMAT
jgi:hypothetical protein